MNPGAVAFDAEVVIALMAERQIQKALDRGDFDDLPGAGEPLDLSDHDDPDWWIKRYLKRERLVSLPPSLQLRKDDAELDAELDAMSSERAARREVEDFNTRAVNARYQTPEGPPLITMPRDVEATIGAWAARRAARAEQARTHAEIATDSAPGTRRGGAA